MSFDVIWQHIYIVLVSTFISTIFGVLLGIVAYMMPKIRNVILKIVDVLQTIPALALLGIIMVFFGAGTVTVILGITLYSLLPIVNNTYLGLNEVDSGIKEAAKGMGMSNLYRLFHVELPMAFPMILTGIRIAVINAIGTAVFAAFVGGGGLGTVLNKGIRVQDMKLIFTGTFILMIFAVVMDLIMNLIESYVKKRKGDTKAFVKCIVGVCLTLCIVLLSGSIFSKKFDSELVMYDGDYSEPQIMTRMVKYLVEDRSNLRVTIKDEMTQVNGFKSLTNKKVNCDMMASYDGSILNSFMHIDPKEVPQDMTLFSYANKIVNKRHNLEMIAKFGYNNTYTIAVTPEVAKKYNLKKISDLIPVADQLVFGAEHVFFSKEGSIRFEPFTKYYGLNFKDAKSLDVSLKYASVENGDIDVVVVYTTDGLNKKVGLITLEDDRNFFPEYNGTVLVKSSVLDKYKDASPNLREILMLLDDQITNEEMQEMTYEVDVKGKSSDKVAKEFLIKKGLLKK